MKRWGVLLAVLGFVFALPGIAFGYWLSSPTPASVRVTAGSLPTGRAPVAVAAGHAVRITPTPVAGAVDAYLIERSAVGGPVVASLRCGASCAEPSVPDGRWTYTETALLGTWRGPAGPASAPVTVDTTAPSPVLVSPVATNVLAPVLVGRAGTAAGDAATVLVRLYAGSRVLAQRSVPVRHGQWRWAVGRLTPQRRYPVVVQQRDAAGNTGQTRSSVVIDTRGPDVRLAPVAWPALSGQAGARSTSSTSSADLLAIDVQIFAGARLITTFHTTRVGARWSVVGTGLGTGDYTARAVQRDEAGNVSISQIRSFSVDATAPVVTIDVPVYVRTAPILSGTAGSADGDQASVLVELGPVGGPVLQRRREPVVAGTWRAVLRPLPPGQRYQVTVTQLDDAGNRGEETTSFVLDITPPKLSLSYAGGVLSGQAGAQPATDQASPDDTTVTITVDETVLSVPVLGGTYSTLLPALPPGTYQVTVEQRDAAGNIGRASIEITVAPPAN